MSFMSTAPDEAVLKFPGKGIDAPLILQRRHHIKVAMHHQCVRGRVLAGQTGDHVGAAGGRFEDFSFEADLADQSCRIFGGGTLARA